MRPTDISDKQIPTADPGQLIIQYTPLIYKIALRYQRVLEQTGSVDVDDLLQAGRIAIYTAQKTYDPEGGATFKSFIFDRIRSAMRRTLGFNCQTGLPPDVLDYLDEPLADDADVSKLDMIPDDAPTAEERIVDQDTRQEITDAVHAAIDRIKSDKQREVITRVWIDGQDRAAAAADMGIRKTALHALDNAGRMTLKHDWRLERFAMPFFPVGIMRYRTTWTSCVEEAVIWREEHSENLKLITEK